MAMISESMQPPGLSYTMSLKRKGSALAEETQKRLRQVDDDGNAAFSPDDEMEIDRDHTRRSVSPANSEDDPLRDFTEDGQRRADSEARRRWNYACTVAGCTQRFNRPCRLEAHMRSHNKERPFMCGVDGCDKTFPRKDHLNRHIKNAHTEIERSFVCDWEGCNKTFTSSTRLQRHKDVHDSKFHCTGHPPCREVFRKAKTLEAHIKAKHLQTVPFPCDYVDEETGERCTSGYQTEPALRKHKSKKHAEEPDAMFFCMRCPAPGSELDAVETEDGVVHVATEPLPFPKYEDLVAHTREFHPPVCSECGQKCADQATLKSHFQLTHSNPEERPKFPCPRPSCGRVFNRSGNLNTHIRTVHEQQRRFFCDPSFFENSKHDDLKNWDGANACGVPYSAKSSLEQHVRTHHLGLDNRKTTRKVAKGKAQQTRKKPDPSAIRLLTGIGFDGGRDVPCLVDGCEFRFFMDRDLRRHLSSSIHNIPKEEVEEMICERDALHGGQFWIGGLDDQPMFESTDPSVPQTPDPFHSMGAYTDMSHAPYDAAFDSMDHALDVFGKPYETFDTSFLDEEALLDQEMGLSNLPALDVHTGLPLNPES